MNKIFGGWGAFVVCVFCLAIGIGGIGVGIRCHDALTHFEAVIERLETENAQLRDALSAKTEHPIRQEMTLIVKDRTKQSKSSLAVQNRNFLNIKRCSNGDKWVGEIGVDKYGHVIFSDPAYSIRAGAITLMAYEDKHGINTVEKLVKRFSENNHDEYAAFISKRLGVKKTDKISLRAYMPQLLRAMVAFETGMNIDEYAELVATLK